METGNIDLGFFYESLKEEVVPKNTEDICYLALIYIPSDLCLFKKQKNSDDCFSCVSPSY